MNVRVFERRRLYAQLIFDLEDAYARDRQVRGPHPRPLGDLRFRLLGEVVAGVRQDFDRPLELLVTANASGHHLFHGAVRLADGSRRRIELADGVYVVAVASDLYQTEVREDVAVPQLHPVPGPYRFDLEAGFAYPFPRERVSLDTLPNPRVVAGPTLLRGTLHRTDGRGIAGAAVEVVGQSRRYETDESGHWVLVFPDDQPAGPVTVRFELPGGPIENVAGVHVEPGRVNSFQQAALRGFVLSTGGVPIPGARVRVAGRSGETATDGTGAWFYYFPLSQPPGPVNVVAEIPGGADQTDPNVPVQPGAAVRVATFRFQL